MEYRYQFYNNANQLIYEHKSTMPISNLDSIAVIPPKFYYANGKIESETVNENGKKIKKKYEYKFGNLSKEIKENLVGDLIESKTYSYSAKSQIDSILIFKNGISTIEINEYDKDGRIVNKLIKGKKKLL